MGRFSVVFFGVISSVNLIEFISKVNLATLVEADPKAPFSIATALVCRGVRYFFFPWIAPLYPSYAPYNAEN